MGVRDWGMFGRGPEMARLSVAMDGASSGHGRAILLAGEPGVGKSRLVAESMLVAKSRGFSLYEGAFSQDSAKPYEAFCRALGDDIVGGEEHVGFAQILAIDASGLLIAKAVPQGGDEVDSDIFAGMLTAVQNFVKDSFGGGEGSLGRLEYGEMKIVMEAMGPAILVAFFTGTEHPEVAPFVRTGARRIAETYGTLLETWGGRTDAVSPVQREIERMAAARFLARRDLAGVKLDKERLRIADLILTRLQASSRSNPVLLVLEDLHWADEGSMHALDYISRNASAGKLLVVATTRRSESPKVDAALLEMSSSGTLEPFDLGGISTEAVSGLLAKELSPNDFPPEFAAQMVSECRGNPFFLTEVLRQMLVDGTIRLSDGRYSLLSADTPLPKNVDELVQRRLDSLDPDVIALAEYASCAGREFPVSAALSMRSLKDAPLALEKLRATGIVSVSESGAGEFSHAFYRDAIYGNIVPRWKNVYHRGLGEHYESAYDGRLDEAAYELARHFSMTGEKPKAVKYGVMAGEKAEAAYAAEKAIAYYSGALDTLNFMPKNSESSPKEADLNERIGDASLVVGDLDGAQARFSKAAQLWADPEPRGRAHRKLADNLINKSRYEEAIAELSLAKESLSNIQSPELGRVLVTEGSMHHKRGEYGKCIDTQNEAIKIFELFHGHERDICSAYNNIANALWYKGDLSSAMEIHYRNLKLHEKIGNLKGQAATLNNIGIVYLRLADYDKASEYLTKGFEIFRRIGDIHGQANSMGNLGNVMSSKGRNEEALDNYNKALRINERIGDRYSIGSLLNNIGIVLTNLHKPTEAMDALKRSLDIRTDIKDRRGQLFTLTNIAKIHHDLGDHVKAIEVIEGNLGELEALGDKSLISYTLITLSSSYLGAGRLDDAEKSARRIIEITDASGMAELKANGLAALGLAHFAKGKQQDAEDIMQKAVGTCATINLDRTLAKIELDWGKALVKNGVKEKARPHIEKALEIFRRLDLEYQTAESTEELSNLDGR